MNTLKSEVGSDHEKQSELEKIQKEGNYYKYQKSQDKWIKVFGEIKKGELTLYSDNQRQKIVMGPFVITREAKINKIQIFKEKYALSLFIPLNNNGLFNLKIGFDETGQALEWQDAIEKVKMLSKQVNQGNILSNAVINEDEIEQQETKEKGQIRSIGDKGLTKGSFQQKMLLRNKIGLK